MKFAVRASPSVGGSERNRPSSWSSLMNFTPNGSRRAHSDRNAAISESAKLFACCSCASKSSTMIMMNKFTRMNRVLKMKRMKKMRAVYGIDGSAADPASITRNMIPSHPSPVLHRNRSSKAGPKDSKLA